jgi:hypothetical protein
LEQCVNAAAQVGLTFPLYCEVRFLIASNIQAPEAARTIAMQQMETLTACANGLTPSEEDMFDLDPEDTVSTSLALELSRQHADVAKLRGGILQAVSRVIEIWGADVEVASVSAILRVRVKGTI